MQETENKVTAFTVCGGNISETVGSAEEFVLLDNNTSERKVCTTGVLKFLQEYNAGTLVCGGIGNCLLEVLTNEGIRVIPGISGTFQDADDALRRGTLAAGTKYSCAERGQICGDCKGKY